MLSPAQQHAATATGHVVIAACPGSGKTTVLKFRAENLLRADPKSTLAAVTFTSDAAKSLRERILQQYPAAGKRLAAGTFHSICLQQLAAQRRKQTVASDHHIRSFINAGIKACKHADPALEVNDYIQAIAEWQRQIEPDVPAPEVSALGFVYHYYRAEKKRYGLIDYDDAIRDCVLGYRDGSMKPLPVTYMLVDEFQDTDNMQLLWVLEHVKAGTQVTIVGDDDQSIYAFRGSMGYAGMMEFLSQTQATEIKLDRTYRCSRTVIEKAANLISFNTARVQKDLNTASQEVGEVVLVSCVDQEDEINRIIETIVADGNPSDWAVLARNNSALHMLEASIHDAFEYQIKGDKTIFELEAPAKLITVASSFAGFNMLGVSELLTMSGVSKSVVDKLAREIEFEKSGGLDRFCNMRLPRGSNKFLEQMQGTITEWRDQVRSNNKLSIKMAVNGMAAHVAKYGNFSGKQAHHQRLLEYTAQAIHSLNGTLEARLRTIERKKEKTEGKGTCLMTFHSSKGLEFEKVWIMGCDQGVVPSKRDDTDVAEERRLMYVAITRAKDYLVLSKTLSNPDGPSIFLSEMDGIRAYR